MATQRISFTPKARLIKILGEHLIKDATVGLLELVKNSYDADATRCEIIMTSLNESDASITIKDNGCGMDLETFLKKWMNPATGHKEEQKRNKIRTRLGRLPLGEKGVGRFAAQQIGNRFKMISLADNSPQELVVDIDWRKFDDNKADLKDITVEYKLQVPQLFKKGDESGTILEISKLKYNWTIQDIQKISGVLKRMKSPFRGATDFDVKLTFENCPDGYSLYENLESTDILDKAHYKLYGIIDSKGILQFEYDVNLPGQPKTHKEESINLREFGKVADVNGDFLCGGFIINFYHYNKLLDKVTGFNRNDINELSGVSIFRDGIRILPYGEKGNDWLNLDTERIQNTSFIGNDTIIGMVEIDQIENPDLIDKANREGLIENVAYDHLKRLVFCCVDFLYKEKQKERVKSNGKQKDAKEKREKSFKDLKEKIEKTTSGISGGTQENNVGNELQEIGQSVDDIKQQIDESVEDLESSNKRLFNLAGTGLAAERFTHEFSRLVAGANESLDRLKKQVDISNARVKKEVDTIYGALEALRNDIKLLGPLFYIKKVASEKELNIKEIVENSLSLMQNSMTKSNVVYEVVGESFKIKMREGSCMQIFVNLLDNSIYWLSKKSEQDDRKIKIIIEPSTFSVFVTDNGPGVVSRYRDKIFDPFFSMKGESGRGLGLYIIKEILEEKKWDIVLVFKEDYPDLLKGASFKILFTENKE